MLSSRPCSARAIHTLGPRRPVRPWTDTMGPCLSDPGSRLLTLDRHLCGAQKSRIGRRVSATNPPRTCQVQQTCLLLLLRSLLLGALLLRTLLLGHSLITSSWVSSKAAWTVSPRRDMSCGCLPAARWAMSRVPEHALLGHVLTVASSVPAS